MALRDRQIGGIPLVKVEAAILTVLCALTTPIMAIKVWFPLFSVPAEFRLPIIVIGFVSYIGQCIGNVPKGKERAQLFFGMYTGVSFSAGLYLLPKLPFPFILLMLRVITSEVVYQYLGWVLEGDVSVESVVITFSTSGLSKDGIRVQVAGSLIFEVENAAVYLSQASDETSKVGMKEALKSGVEEKIKRKVIMLHTVKQLKQADHEGVEALSLWFTEACFFSKDFGVSLSRIRITDIDILSKNVERAFDADLSQELFRRSTNEIALAFAEFRSKLPSGMSDDTALLLFNIGRNNEGLPNVTMANVKMK